ncbi:MAG: 3-isopropylmalate dehydratase small subunit [Gammaproteobacteria bacterium]
MSEFAPLKSVGVPIMRANIDTDALIPGAQPLKFREAGFGDGLFANWRYIGDASEKKENPDFALNDPAYQEAKILLSGPNFACGSSREQAVWALHDWGFRCVIAPGFGSIFYANSFRNGLLPIVLPESQVETLAEQTDKSSPDRTIAVDLVACQVIAPNGEAFPFTISEYYRSILLEGLDPLEAVMKYGETVRKFLDTDKTQRPWVYSGVAEKGMEAN